MEKGIYIALSGSILKQGQMDVISNNIANANTVGFKKRRSSFERFLISRISGAPGSDDGRAMSDLSTVRTDFATGNHVKTGNPLDVALEGDGFLCLEGGRYTRKGDLRVGKDGYLLTQAGRKVLGSKGPIRLPAGKADISPSGEVRVDGAAVDALKIAAFDNLDALEEVEDGHYVSSRPAVKSSASVASGHLEESNVEVIKEMVQLITTMREFETYQKTIQAFDEAETRVTTEMAKV